MSGRTERRARARTHVDAARKAAFDALLQVELEGAFLNLVVPRMLAERGLSGRDAAFATELAHGTTRRRGSYDLVLDGQVRGGLASLEPAVLTGLRLGVHQLLSLRVASHAAVGTSVELVREAVGERPVRMVNAVLRSVGGRSLDEWLAELAPSMEADRVGHLGNVTSHPRWIVEVFDDALGERAAELPALLEADNEPARVTLVVRPGLADVAELVAAGAEAGRWSPYAAVLPGGDPGSIGLVRSGRAAVQDEGSQLAALALARAEVPDQDRTWLDMCAGPGGKAALLLGLADQRQARLIASERLPHRARLVADALRSYGRRPVVVADGRRPAWLPGTFDRVLVDAPCTGLGALRRRPDARWRHQPADVDDLVPLQRELLRSALDSARAGGVIAYVTCSPHPDETVGVLRAVLAERSGIEVLDVRPLLPEVSDLGAGPTIQLWPHRHGTDAMFISLLRRTPRDAAH